MNVQILYVTRNPYNGTIPAITPEEARSITRTWTSFQRFYNDKETTGIDAQRWDLLLDCWWCGDRNQPCLVLDSRTVNTLEVIDNADVHNKIIVAYNGDFEARWNLSRGLVLGEYSCPMVATKTILQGADELDYDIVAELRRRQIEIPEGMDKDIRNEFIGNPNLVIEDRHVIYNAFDVIVLPELEAKQQVHIDKFNLNFLIHRLRGPLVKILAQSSLTGFVHNQELWLEILNRRKIQAAECAAWLGQYLSDNQVDILKIRPKLQEEIDRINNRYTKLNERLAKLNTQIDSFEERGKTTTKAYQLQVEMREKVLADLDKPAPEVAIEINWGSSDQVLGVLNALNINPLPTDVDKETRRPRPSVSKNARNDWFANNPEHPRLDFMKKLDEFKSIEHNIKSFGQAWIDTYYNPKTGKVHTIFRQAGTTTGRFAAGDADNGLFNIQQIPKTPIDVTAFADMLPPIELPEDPEERVKALKKVPVYRLCFGTDPGRSIGTFDYTGCEIVCMISLSHDLELKRITELPDQHSYLGTKCWRAVYQHRYEKTQDPKWKELAETYTMPSKSKARDLFKQSGVFPVVYGVKEGKVASIQGFVREEGGIFIRTIEAEMPNVINFVKAKAAGALANGYVVHNTRTNSRRWFESVLYANRHGLNLSNKEEVAVESAARNSPIQGTNADIIIEAIVTIMKWARLYKVDLRLLGQVHDELIFDFKDEDAEWITTKIKLLMERTAQRYLIPEISMKVDAHHGKTWIK